MKKLKMSKLMFCAASFSLSGLALTSAGIPAEAATTPAPFTITGWEFPPLASFNLFSPNYANAEPLVNLPLALANHPTMDKYYPMLAASWKVTPTKITVNLRHDIKWQNGDKFTTKDVIDTLAIGGAFNWVQLTSVSKVTAPNPYTVVFDLVKGANTGQVLSNILNTYFVPASQYGQFVTKDLLKDDLISAQSVNTPASVSKVLGNVKAAVLKYNPTSFIGNGPFEWKSLTTNMGVMVKNDNYFDASKIKVQEIDAPQTQNANQIVAYLLNGKTDYSWAAEPENINKAFTSKPGNHMQHAWDWSEYSWYFNTKKYPMNLVQVRQAIAHVIDRKTALEVGDGPEGGRANTYITGLQWVIAQKWIPSNVMKTLDPYDLNTAKAAKLLESVGFKKQNGQWIMPNGKPFTLTMISPATWTDTQLATEAAANELTQFGIHTTASSVEQPGYWTQQNKGQYDISWGWGGWWVFNPLQQFYDNLVNQNYTPNQPGYIGMGFGPSVKVPGLGNVNLADNLTQDLKIQNPKTIQKLAVDYAKLVNQQLPWLPYADKQIGVMYSDSRYTNWPAGNDNVWNQIGGDATGALLIMMLHGYVVPK